jgi:hypothetical protein
MKYEPVEEDFIYTIKYTVENKINGDLMCGVDKLDRAELVCKALNFYLNYCIKHNLDPMENDLPNEFDLDNNNI